MFNKSLLATLRLHSSPITCIENFYIPSSLTYINEDDSKSIIFNPTVITADESGLIVWWNLITCRPFGVWKAHNDSVLTVKQLGIKWTQNSEESDFTSPITYDSYGQLLTHSKDGSVKIWKLLDVTSKENLEFTYTGLLKKKVTTEDEMKSVTPPKLFEMPVNTLNFANIDINIENFLITPSTIDSDGFDIYQIDLNMRREHEKLKRVVHDYKLSTPDSEVKITEIEDDQISPMDFTRRCGLGVIMKIKWLDTNTFIIGYESGQIVVYEFAKDEGDFKVKNIFSDASLIGNAITALTFDAMNKKILFGSTGSEVAIMNLDDHQVKTFCTKHKGINDIDTDSSKNTVSLITWDGYTRIYNYDENDVLKFVMKMRRQVPTISTSQEAVDEQNNGIVESSNMQRQRANVLKFTEKQLDPSTNKNIEVEYSNGRSKNIIRRNREKIFSSRYLFVGYQDGKVAVYTIQ
ncbi:uncharacterized protein C5L36_0C05670 [Pichia kudriavzevii]|uniref:ASTRA-associated protein 1 n=1 Tax=Pichia kudriavzevii TaxID=4909 RepID=A0A2U9R5Y4_PICKU|nr:uncharacterized protein C5L36_0C05670 [Pichia kudriavzevii]AWU76641.1 hypothetical protein C5L36_0C05670 [Pichia kudriavzevii]